VPCYHPLLAYRSLVRSPGGGFPIQFKRTGTSGPLIQIACGQCLGCRLERSQAWATRIMHEAQMHEENAFLTLTYAPEKLPPDSSLHKEDFRNFMKRYRKALQPLRIRFFHCGEYGETTGRPHYHAAIFGHDFKDKKPWAKNPQGQQTWTSSQLNELWGLGHCIIGSLSMQSAAYVARYVMKKVTGPQALEHYSRIEPETGEVTRLQPEYITMSRNPGIGKNWLDQFGEDCYSEDFVPLQGGKSGKVPDYYLKELRKTDEKRYESIKKARQSRAKANAKENTWQRLETKQAVKAAAIRQLKRNTI